MSCAQILRTTTQKTYVFSIVMKLDNNNYNIHNSQKTIVTLKSLFLSLRLLFWIT